MKYLITIITILILGCSGSNVDSGTSADPVYRLSFQDHCTVLAVNDLAHEIECQDQVYTLFYYFDLGEEVVPLVAGDPVIVEFTFETDEYSHERFTLIEMLIVQSGSQPTHP